MVNNPELWVPRGRDRLHDGIPDYSKFMGFHLVLVYEIEWLNLGKKIRAFEFKGFGGERK